MKFKLVATDFDWTLGIAPGIIEQSTLNAIKLYQQKGGRFCIVSGRKTSALVDICNKYNLDCDLISYQGASIILQDKTVLYSSGVNKDSAIKVTNELIKDDLTILVYADDKLYFSRLDKYSKVYLEWNKVPVIVSENIIDVIKNCNVCRKVMCMNDIENTQKIIDKYQTEFGNEVSVNSGAPGLVEIVDKSNTKGNALKMLAKHYGININQVITVGDSLNDMELLTCGGYSVAVGNACQQLKNVANEVTVPFEQKPVEVILKKYCL